MTAATKSSKFRGEVLRTFRKILRVARTWEAQNEAETVNERLYIREEARTLFRKNKYVSQEGCLKVALIFILLAAAER